MIKDFIYKTGCRIRFLIQSPFKILLRLLSGVLSIVIATIISGLFFILIFAIIITYLFEPNTINSAINSIVDQTPLLNTQDSGIKRLKDILELISIATNSTINELNKLYLLNRNSIYKFGENIISFIMERV